MSGSGDAGRGGRITLVATPIGNLGDISERARSALATAERIACEDTRRTGKLLERLGISRPRLVRMDDHTERAVAGSLVKAASRGEEIVVVTDAGTPGLSDPGAAVVAAAIDAGIALEVVPGPFAGAAAAVLSGLLDGAGRFTFEGFLPRKGKARAERLTQVGGSRVPVVLYEAPNRVVATVDDLIGACGPHRRVALSRELTKLHEQTWRGTLEAAGEYLGENPPRGEFVITVGAAPAPPEASDEQIAAALGRHLGSGASARDAAAEVAGSLGVAPNRVKRIANSLGTAADEPSDSER